MVIKIYVSELSGNKEVFLQTFFFEITNFL